MCRGKVNIIYNKSIHVRVRSFITMAKVNKSLFILLMLTCRRAFCDTECSHYYIPMIEDKLGPNYYIEPAKSSDITLDDIVGDDVPRNCILLFNCDQIANEFCERPLLIKPNVGKDEFISPNTTIIQNKNLLTTFPTIIQEIELATTMLPATVEEQLQTTTMLPATVEEQLQTTILPETVEEEQLQTTTLPETVEEQLQTTTLPETVEEEQIAVTTLVSTVDKEQSVTTLSTTVVQQPVINTNELDDSYLIKINDSYKLNVSDFIKKNGCTINSDDSDNGILIYDCENLSIDNFNEDFNLKDQINIDKQNETNCMNYKIIINETASDTGYILHLNSKTGRGSLNKTEKTCVLTIACNNNTDPKCKLIESNTISKSYILPYTSTTPASNRKEPLKCISSEEICKRELSNLVSTTTEIITNQEVESTSSSSIAQFEIVTLNTDETNIHNATDLNDINFNASNDTSDEISTAGYNDVTINKDDSVQSTTDFEDIITESTITITEVTTVKDKDTTLRTTLGDLSIASSERSLLKGKDEQYNILPIVMISFGAVAILSGIYLLARKCFDLRKSGEYEIPQEVEMNQRFNSC